ncbi:MAG TPA: DUF6491 family protein [Steroidobacteraceae bacterium]|nr:DUF6491 family protein [Steroidobacteraceae bacterium]
MRAMTLSLALLAAATPPLAQPQARPIGKVGRSNDCIFQSSISSFRVLDDRHLVLYGFGQREIYLAELAPACFDVESQSSLGTVDGDMNGQICGYGRDGISFRRFARREECRITAFERLSKARADQLLGEDQDAGKDKNKDQDPGEDRD